jgi:hypothetical protein
VECHRYHLASWQHVTMEKDFGGLGVPSLRELNLCLLGSWVRRYAIDGEKIWKEVIDFKYNTYIPNIFRCKDDGAYNFFGRGYCGLQRQPRWGYKWKIGNSTKVRFWEDTWHGSSSLVIQFWEIYSINEQNRSIDQL